MKEFEHRQNCLNPVYSPTLYWLGREFTNVAFNILWRRKTLGRENIPAPGRATIFAANHRSFADPNLVGTSVGYPIHYFAKSELFEVPLLGWYIRRVNAFPVRRLENDISAFKTAQRVLKQGEALLLFPEGGRRLTPDRQFVAKAGVGMLACKTGAQVCPVGVIHSEHFPKPTKLEVRFGKVLQPPPNAGREDYDKFSNQVMSAIRELCQ